MFMYFIMFIITGFIIGNVLQSKPQAMGAIIIISVLWMFPYGPWAIATLIELLMGYALAIKMKED